MKDRDLLFGMLAIQRGYTSADQIASCIREQAQCLKDGQVLRLGQVMVRRKMLTAGQFMELLEDQEQQILVCPTCHKRYNVRHHEAGKRVKCRGCKAILTVPTDLDAIADGELIDIDEAARRPPPPRPVTPAPDAELTRESVSGYSIGEKIGQGGMGAVYRAVDKKTGQAVALKIASAQSAEKLAQYAQRLDREIAMLRKLRHPAIVEIKDHGAHHGRPYYAMELVEGPSLAQRIERGDRKDELVDALIEVAYALELAHSQRIVHRDLKPGNVLFDAAMRPRLTDFGLSRDLDAETLLTGSGQVVGTPHYMAPEQILGDEASIGPACDVYALGVILYQILAGQLPHDASSVMELYSQVLEESPRPPSVHAPEVPPELDRVVMRALAKEPALRYPSASPFARALEEAASPAVRRALRVGDRSGTTSKIVLPPPPPSGAEPVVSRADRTALAVFLAVVRRWARRPVVVVVACGLAYLLGSASGWRLARGKLAAATALSAAEHALGSASWREALAYFEQAREVGADASLVAAGTARAALALAALECRETADAGDFSRARVAFTQCLAATQAGPASGFAEALPLLAQLAVDTSAPRAVTLKLVALATHRVDPEGVSLGHTPLRVRVPRGRYLLELAPVAGTGSSGPVVPTAVVPLEVARDVALVLDLPPVAAGMVHVPETPGDASRLTAFQVGEREVTVREYYAWLAGLSAEVASRRRPRTDEVVWPDTMPEELADQPVRGIDWHDAFAYALDHGARLPSMLEWRRAYGADDGRAFPWGDAPAPVVDARLGSAGQPALDRSPYGVRGLVAGVREWVGKPDKSGHVPVLGGSWGEPVPALEVRRVPAARADVHTGFRLAASPLEESARRDPSALASMVAHRYYGVALAALAVLCGEFADTPYCAAALADALAKGDVLALAGRHHLDRLAPGALGTALVGYLRPLDPVQRAGVLATWAGKLGTDGAVLLVRVLVADEEGLGSTALAALLDARGEASRAELASALERVDEPTRAAARRALELAQLRYLRAAQDLRATDDWARRRDELVALLSRVIALDSGLVDPYRLRAEARGWGADGVRYGAGADLEGALADCARVLALDGKYLDARLERARLLHALGRAAEGLAEVAILAPLRGDDPELALVHARLAHAALDHAAAEAAARRAYEKHPDRASAAAAGALVVRCQLALGQAEAALVTARAVFERFSDGS